MHSDGKRPGHGENYLPYDPTVTKIFKILGSVEDKLVEDDEASSSKKE